MEGMPQLGISTGPAMSEAGSGGGVTGTGDFNFKPRGSLIQQALPLVALVAVAWLIIRK